MQVLEQPKPEVFQPVKYFDQRKQHVLSPRWVGYPGDLIVPERKAEISWLEAGGEETPSPCLQRYGRGFVPRGRPAILELGGDPIPMAHLGELQSVAWQGISLDEQAFKNKMGFIPVFPGDGLRVLLRYARNPVRKGMDELTTLAGKEWLECHNEVNGCPNGHFTSEPGTPFQTPKECPTCKEPWVILVEGTGILDVAHRAMFSDGMESTLRGLEDQIRHAVLTDSRLNNGKYKEEWLKLCSDYRNWGMREISIAHGLLKTGHVGEWQGGWSYAYAPITEMLMAQLEVTRQDQPMHEMSKLIAQIIPQQAQPAEVSALTMELFERKMEERLAKARAEWEAEQAARTSDVPRETFNCSGCGQEAASKAGLLAHERHCKALNYPDA